MTENQKKWNAQAELALMGFTIPVDSDEQLKHLIGKTLFVLKQTEDDEAVQEIFDGCYKYNSDNAKVTHFTVNSTHFGVMLTFVRDKEMTDITTQDGVLAYVHNLDCPMCSELGYVFFEQSGSKIHRIA